jgi:V/A-type H+-transporting ATPase subunit I
MRYDLNKYLFIGFEGDKEAFFQRAQELGIIHFIKTKSAKVGHIPEDIQDLLKAIKVVKSLEPVEQEEVEEYALADGLAQKILQLKKSEDSLFEEERTTKLEISRVQIFGDFSLENISSLEKETHRKVQFYCAKIGSLDFSSLPPECIFVGSDMALDYFMALNPEPKPYPKMMEILIERPLGPLKKRLKEIKEEIHSVERRLKSYSKYNTFLHHALIYKLNSSHLHEAKSQVSSPLDGQLFAIEGWVPETKEEALKSLIESSNVHVEQVAISPNETIPTYLENEGAGRLGEDLVNIYDTPSHTDKDPSLWVLVFFSFFFAFIVGDAGYGLIFLATALYVRYRYSLNKTGTRVLNLLTILAGSVLVWGVLTTSFFGISLSMDNPLRKISLLQWMVEKKVEYIIQHQDGDWKEWVKKFPALIHVKDPQQFLQMAVETIHGKAENVLYNKFADNIMLELAIFIGVVHLILSMLRYINRNWTACGWIIFIIGCYLYIPNYLHATSLIHFIFGVNKETASQNGLYLIYMGVGLATLIAIFQHKFSGLLEPMHIGQLFADSMSYLRLYALGLSGAMLAATTNDMAMGLNFALGIPILIVGHGVNMLLCIMGGTIHGLRLNFLEWYHYSFEGGGKPFDPLRKLKIE